MGYDLQRVVDGLVKLSQKELRNQQLEELHRQHAAITEAIGIAKRDRRFKRDRLQLAQKFLATVSEIERTNASLMERYQAARISLASALKALNSLEDQLTSWKEALVRSCEHGRLDDATGVYEVEVSEELYLNLKGQLNEQGKQNNPQKLRDGSESPRDEGQPTTVRGSDEGDSVRGEQGIGGSLDQPPGAGS
jgi:hypothetical protein